LTGDVGRDRGDAGRALLICPDGKPAFLFLIAPFLHARRCDGRRLIARAIGAVVCLLALPETRRKADNKSIHLLTAAPDFAAE
jgi:hypothetical protein